MKNLIIIDIETTSLSRSKAGILDLAAIDIESGDFINIPCNGKNPWFEPELNEESLSFNKLQANLKSETTGLDAVNALIDFCLSKYNKPLIGGHNIASFDALICHNTKYGNFDMTWPLGYRFFDMATMAYIYFGEILSSKEIYTKLEMEQEPEPHTAFGGVISEARAIIKLQELISTGKKCENKKGCCKK